MARPSSSARTEREAKLRPSPAFELSGLVGAIGGTTVRALPTQELEAAYLDTHALTLAREGVTVRHRTGDGAPRWTVKLPAGIEGGALVRRELDIEGPRSPRPREISALLRGHLRDRRLVPAATIHTLRSRVVVADDDGVDLVEVAHDLVTASRGRHPLASWEEVEVEALDPERGADAVRQVVQALKRIGCRKASPIPKLVRALGSPAAAPPEVVVPDLPTHPRPHHALEHALARSVRQLLDHDPRVRLGGDPEDLHQFRVASRRLRSDLRTFRRFLPADATEHLVDELRWLADETNRHRDLDVLDGWIRSHRGSLPAADEPGALALLARCGEQLADAHARLVRVLGSDRYRDLVHELVALVDTPLEVSKREDARAQRRLERQVRRRWDALEARVVDLEREPSDEALHRARIAAKRCRAAVEAVVPLRGRRAHRLARSLADLQDTLGAAHDAAVIEAWLRSTAVAAGGADGIDRIDGLDGTGGAFVAGELAAIARAEAAVQRDRWPVVWAQVRRRAAHAQ